MKRAMITVAMLLMGVVASAAPTTKFTATKPTQYQNGTIIPVTDVLTYRVYCGITLGGGYPFVFDAPNLDSGVVIDVVSCVQGILGTYYFVSTATSTVFGTESIYSNEVNRTYTAGDLGKVPLPPTLFTIS